MRSQAVDAKLFQRRADQDDQDDVGGRYRHTHAQDDATHRREQKQHGDAVAGDSDKVLRQARP